MNKSSVPPITCREATSAKHEDTAFTVPLFDEFMRRIIPGNVRKD